MKLRAFVVESGIFWCFAATVAVAYQQPERPSLPNFDRREEVLVQQGPSPEQRAAVRRLLSRMPSAHVDFHPITASPKSIRALGAFLSGTNGEGGGIPAVSAAAFPANTPHRATKAFLKEYKDLFRFGPEVLGQAKVKRQFVTAHNGLTTTVWQQESAGIQVFEAVLISHTSKRGELVSLSSQFVPDLSGAIKRGWQNRTNSNNALMVSARGAVAIAAGQLEEQIPEEQIKPVPVAGTNSMAGDPEMRQEFEAPGLQGLVETKLIWLPLDSARMRLCWDVVLMSQARGEMYRVLVDAGTGKPWVRRCLTDYISDASYRVFSSESPSPFSPGYTSPTTNQPPLVSRTLVTLPALDTNASPAGWINDGINETYGNNVDAHTDWNNDNQPDLPRPHGSPDRVFDFPLDLTNAPHSYKDAAVVQLFYWCNWMHDQLYSLGFTEAAGNFQNDNFGRGGIGNDAILADAQDGGGYNNANFSTLPDGVPGRMQMYLFNGPNPARDGDLDAQIILHEYTHGLSNRRVGGGTGISALQSRGMGEGWSDFYALALLSEPGDDVDGTYAFGAYVTYLFSGLTQNYYFGVRRYPYCTDMAQNPLTFKDIDPTRASTHPGIPRNPVIESGANEVHNMGEVWCVTLWEARANLIKKYGWATGNRLILQLVTDAMNLSPPNPTFLEARDAILQADQLDSGGADQRELWNAFAKRGMGAYATCPNSSTTIGVYESFQIMDGLQVAPLVGPSFTCQIGQPINPSCQTYSMINTSDTNLTWAAYATEPWVTVEPSTGLLPPDGTDLVNVCLAPGAGNLPSGDYSCGIIFSNASTSVAHTVYASLYVSSPRISLVSLDSDPGWPREGEWAFGQPAGQGGAENGYPDPAAGASGTNVFGVNLDGDYSLAVGGPYYLTAGPFDFSGCTELNISFQRWLNSDSQPFVYATFEVSSDGTNWSRIWENGENEITDNDWNQVSYDISTIADDQPNVRVRWGYQVASVLALPYSGWNLDDIEFVGNLSRQLAISIPPVATEGAGEVACSMTVLPPPPADLTVSLASSQTNVATIPPSIVVPAGQSNAVFNLTVGGNGGLSEIQTVHILASAAHYAASAADILVLPQADAVVTVTLPVSVWENAGVLTNAGSVSLPQALPVNMSVSLTSSVPGKVSVPATVTIPAGQAAVSFDLEVLDNSVADGNESLTIQAGASGFIDGSAAIVVLDDETPPTPANPSPANLATDVNQTNSLAWELGVFPGGIITNDVYFGTNPTPGSGEFVGSTTNLNWSLPPLAPQTTYYWQIVARSVGVTPGPVWAFTTRGVDHFSWDSIPPLQRVNEPFQVRVTAWDSFDTIVSNFTGTVNLRAPYVQFSPTTLGPFTDGIWQGNVVVEQPATNVVLVADDDAGHTGVSSAFDVGESPVITAQPTDRYVAVGGTVTFDVGANGTLPLSYQWSFNGTNLDGATNSLLVIENVEIANAGVYAVAVTNGFGSIISSNALLVVGKPPAITEQPTNQSVAVGASVSFAVTVEGTPPFNYQWSFDGTNLDGATNNDLVLENVQMTNAGSYAVEVANLFGSIVSSNAELVVGEPPEITAQPTDQYVTVSGTATFEVGANGTLPLSYQWSFNGTNLDGATNSDLVIENVQTTDVGNYAVEVTNGFGSIVSSNAALVVGEPPAITEQPTNQSVAVGSSISFAVTVEGTPPFNYQWSFDGTNLDGATNNDFVIENVQMTNAGSYAVEVANPFGSTVSSNAELVVGEPPDITAQPPDRYVAVGETATFDVGVSGTLPLSYQWSFNGTNLDGATNGDLVIENVEIANVGNYAVAVTNEFGSIVSSNALLVVGNPPAITEQPTNQSIAVGVSVSFMVTVEGTLPFNYQWTFNGTNVDGATNSELMLENVQTTNAGSYAVEVANLFGSTISSNAELVVGEPPEITAQPTDQYVTVGGTATFEVGANGTLPLSYQWSFNGTNLDGATNSDLVVENVQTANMGNYAVAVTNGFGSIVSSNALLVIGDPPAITEQPTNQSVAVGASVSFAVTVEGTPPFNYQWSFDGTNLDGATNSELVLENVQMTNAGSYAVEVANPFGSTVSSNAELVVGEPPEITAQPTDRYVAVGAPATFDVGVSGTLPLSYQWSFNGTNLDGATNSDLVIENVQTTDVGNYAVAVTNGFGSTVSPNAMLVVGEPPGIAEQPTNQSVPVGASVSFAVTVEGTAPFNYQWTFGGTNVDGATNSELVLENAQTTNAGSYAVEVANLFGSTISSNAELVVGEPPEITTPPTDRYVAVGGTATFEVGASGTLPLSYQWSFNGTNLDGATNSLLMISDVQRGNEGVYAVAVTNGFGSIVSSNAALVVGEPPAIVEQPTNQSIAVGVSVSFAVTVEGTPPFNYQWSFDGTNLDGATNNDFVIENVQMTNAGSYAVEVDSQFGSTVSSNAELVVGEPPDITAQPTNRYVVVGGTATFEVGAGGTLPLSYQWNFNGTNLDGATNSDLVIENVQMANVGNYAVEVTNGFGSIVSSNAVLAVGEPPGITEQPTNQSVQVGASVSFAVTVEGTPPLNYQWTFNGTNMDGATNSEMVLENVQTTNAGNYAVEVGNLFGSTVSSNAELVVGEPPEITAQPTDRYVAVGGTATFDVGANGTLPLSYQWSFNGTNLDGETNSDLVIENVQTTDVGNYAVAVTNGFGSIVSSNALLVVGDPPAITEQPTNQSVAVGASVSFAVTVEGTPPFNYQWSFDGMNLDGATNNDFVIENVQMTNAGSYAVEVANLFGSIVSSNAELVVGEPPDIIAQPTNRYVVVGGTANFEVGASGTLPLSYQWSFNGTKLEGATNSLLTISDVQMGNEGVYAVAVTNGFGSAVSWNAVLVVGNPPGITEQPTNLSVAVGKAVSFAVTVGGTPPFNYQWTFGGTNLDGATNSELVMENVQITNAGSYAVEVASLFGSTVSSNAELVVGEPPDITAQPTNQTLPSGSATMFNVIATGTDPLTYQWYKDNLPLSDDERILGAHSATLTISNLFQSDSGFYSVLASNSFGSTASSNAALSVYVLDHFEWDAIPSPRFVNIPFPVSIRAVDATNGLATQFDGTVTLASAPGVAFHPSLSGLFVQGQWTGLVTVSQAVSGLVLMASDDLGHVGNGNAFNVITLPLLSLEHLGQSVLISWPTNASGFVLETSTNLSLPAWMPASGNPYLFDDYYTIRFRMTSSNAFYRLRSTNP